MGYSIGEVSKITGISAYTLRYYEKEGLLHNIERKTNGLREYTDQDIELLNIINCLKDTGISISHIKDYIHLCKQGEETLDTRIELFKKQRNHIISKIELLKKHLDTANYKIWYYENVTELGDENDPLNCMKMREIYEKVSVASEEEDKVEYK